MRPEQREELVGFDDKGKREYRLSVEPSVLLVHDHGVYLMSNDQPRDLVEANGKHSYCAYAKGCHSEQNANWYDTARALVGGDDFGETLPWARAIHAAIQAEKKQVIITCGRNRVSMSFR